jgi:hypothetical protein
VTLYLTYWQPANCVEKVRFPPQQLAMKMAVPLNAPLEECKGG